MTEQEAIEIITNAIQTQNLTVERDKALAIIQKAMKCCEPFEVRDIIKQQQETINRQQAELERLERHTEMYHEVRAEAVKEFAERLKGLMLSKYCVYFNAEITEVLIDNLVKEMVGEG